MDSGASPLSVLLVTERSPWGTQACVLLSSLGAEVTHVPWSFGDDRAAVLDEFAEWHGDYILAFKADIKLPQFVRDRAQASVNFHPGPPWYRGMAAPERAIRNGDLVYGVTAHHMLEELDAGRIIDLHCFTVAPGTSISALRARVGTEMLSQLVRVWTALGSRINEHWGSARDHIWGSETLSLKEAKREGLL